MIAQPAKARHAPTAANLDNTARLAGPSRSFARFRDSMPARGRLRERPLMLRLAKRLRALCGCIIPPAASRPAPASSAPRSEAETGDGFSLDRNIHLTILPIGSSGVVLPIA
jgi:hypothetical protein